MGVKVRKDIWMYRYLVFGLLTLLISTSIAVTSFGGQFEDAMAALNRGDYVKASRLMKPLAEQGEAKAQAELGEMYATGQGVEKDYAEAEKWLVRQPSKETPLANTTSESCTNAAWESRRTTPRQ